LLPKQMRYQAALRPDVWCFVGEDYQLYTSKALRLVCAQNGRANGCPPPGHRIGFMPPTPLTPACLPFVVGLLHCKARQATYTKVRRVTPHPCHVGQDTSHHAVP